MLGSALVTTLGLSSRDLSLVFMRPLIEVQIYSHAISMLPIFHCKPFEDPYRHVDELTQVCEIKQMHNVSADVMKMKLFHASLGDQAKDWFLKLEKGFTNWIEMEEEFLR